MKENLYTFWSTSVTILVLGGTALTVRCSWNWGHGMALVSAGSGSMGYGRVLFLSPSVWSLKALMSSQYQPLPAGSHVFGTNFMTVFALSSGFLKPAVTIEDSQDLSLFALNRPSLSPNHLLSVNVMSVSLWCVMFALKLSIN